MIPEIDRSKNNKKYYFEKMEVGCEIPFKDIKHAKSIRACAMFRGYRVCIRTVNDEKKLYFAGKR